MKDRLTPKVSCLCRDGDGAIAAWRKGLATDPEPTRAPAVTRRQPAEYLYSENVSRICRSSKSPGPTRLRRSTRRSYLLELLCGRMRARRCRCSPYNRRKVERLAADFGRNRQVVALNASLALPGPSDPSSQIEEVNLRNKAIYYNIQWRQASHDQASNSPSPSSRLARSTSSTCCLALSVASPDAAESRSVRARASSMVRSGSPSSGGDEDDGAREPSKGLSIDSGSAEHGVLRDAGRLTRTPLAPTSLLKRLGRDAAPDTASHCGASFA